jgi:hypothetical protein
LPLVAICVAIGLDEAGEVRPLRIADSSMHVAVARSARYLAGTPYADRPAITAHVLVPMLHRNTRVSLRPEAGLAQWANCPPGTLFFWDSKYCVKPGRPAAQDTLRPVLRRLGRSVCGASEQQDRVEVFELVSGGAATAMTSPAATQAEDP